MSTVKLKGTRRLARARTRGQSLPLIGLMIVVLVAMVGLSVDVGNTFQTERRAVSASNAAALAGMNAYVRNSTNASLTNRVIYQSIVNSLSSNGVSVVGFNEEPGPGQLQMKALYLDSQGKVLVPGGTIEDKPSRVPNNVAFIQVQLGGVVDTYFARVVGRNDLPVNATAYAGTCPNGEGFYPIGVNNNILQGDNFKDPGDVDPIDGVKDDGWRTLSTGPYAGKTAMRIDVRTTSGGFSWLRWMDSTPQSRSQQALEPSLTIPGNLTQGFEEAPWPNDRPKPPDYPTNAGMLNRGDWVHAATGYRSAADDLMNIHVAEGTRMVLPIYDEVLGNGVNARYQIADFGIFVVLSHGQTPPPGNEKFIELAFLGRNVKQETVCTYSSAPNPAETFDLLGDVSIRPEYAYNPDDRKPVQYVVVLDVSGSMSANFAGQCNKNRNNQALPAKGYWQCTNGPDGAPAVEVDGTGPNYWWDNADTRRIAVAKQALESLVRSSNMPGNSNYDDTRPDDQMAIVWFNEFVSKGNSNITVFGNSNFSNVVGSENSGLIGAINNAGSINGDFYRTQGGTNGAAGLYRAALAFDSAPRDVMLGTTRFDYKRVVVFITDGVSNNFLNKSADNLNGGLSGANTYAGGHFCRSLGELVKENAVCQTTVGGGLTTNAGGVASGMDRPITQAGLVSRQDLQPRGVEVYAIALSNISDTGLRDVVASSSSRFFSATELSVNQATGKTNVDVIMETISTQVQPGPCTPRSDLLDGQPEWRDNIPAAHFQSVAGLTYPNVGEVLLRNNSTVYRIPITADPTSGRLSYFKANVPKGTYVLTPYLYYRHPLDPAGTLPRQYSTILKGDQSFASITVNVPSTENSAGLSQQVKQDLRLKLNGDVCRR